MIAYLGPQSKESLDFHSWTQKGRKFKVVSNYQDLDTFENSLIFIL